MPGVNTSTTIATGPAPKAAVAGTSYFVPGITERGPVNKAVTVKSMADYISVFGDRQAYCTAYDDLRCYFEEGGMEAVVARVVGAAPTAGKLVLKDRAGAPADTLEIDALYVGPYSARLSVVITDGTVADTFTIAILQDGAQVEVYNNIASPAAAVDRLKSSRYVKAVDKASATAAPDNNPDVLAATVLSAGDDKRSGLVAADYVAALNMFDDEWGSGIVAIPTQTASAVGAGILAHCQTYSRIGVVSVPAGSTPDDAKAAAAGLIPDGAGGEYLGLVFPAITVPDDNGGSRTIGPEGYSAANRAKTMQAVGHPNQPPAGYPSRARYVTGVDYKVNRTTGDDLDANQVSAIRIIAGKVELYGWRCLCEPASVADYPLLSYRDLLNFVQVAADAQLETFVFRNVDAQDQRLKEMEGALVGVVEPLAQLSNPAVFPQIDTDGTTIDPGYSVNTGASINTIDSLERQQLNAVLGLRPSPTATVISLTIVKAALTASV